MSKELEALEKIDNTLCLNLNNGTLKFGLDKYDNCDCKNLKEFDECYAVIEKSLKVLEIIKENKIQGLFIKWDGDFWTIEVKGFTYPIAYGRKKEEYDLLKEELL